MRIMATLTGTAFVALLAAEAVIAGQSTPPAQPAAKAKSERLICHEMQETGSIARVRRQCFTRAEWDRIAEAARARGQRLQSDMAAGLETSGN